LGFSHLGLPGLHMRVQHSVCVVFSLSRPCSLDTGDTGDLRSW
jgi:hypothetical protein